MAEGAPLLREYGSKAHRGFESLPLRQIPKSPATRGFLVSDREVGKIQNPVRSTGVRLLGRTAQEDVDAGDARRARTMDKVRPGTGREGALGYGPSQSLPSNSTKSPATRGFLVSDREVGKIQNPVRSTGVRLLGRTAQEDVDAGDARRARTMDKVRPGTGREGALGYGPSQSLP